MSRWLQPGAYYSVLYPDNTKREGRENVQHDVATTLRSRPHAQLAAQARGALHAGDRGDLDSELLNSAVATSALNQAWTVFFAKTTVYF